MTRIFYTIILSMLLLTHPAKAFTSLAPLQPVDNQNNLEELQQYPDEPTNYPRINQIEKSLFKKTYDKQDIALRLDRIELKVFKNKYPNLSFAQRLDNITNNMEQSSLYNSISVNELNNIERKLFKKNYPNEDATTRITRIEKEMLGAMQSGDLTTRFETISKAAKYYGTAPSNNPLGQSYQTQYPIYPQQTYPTQAYDQYNLPQFQNPYNTQNQGGIKGFFKNMLNPYSDSMVTGFTPPIFDNGMDIGGGGYGSYGYNPYSYTPASNQNSNYKPYIYNPQTHRYHRNPNPNNNNSVQYNGNRLLNSIINYGSRTGVRIID